MTGLETTLARVAAIRSRFEPHVVRQYEIANLSGAAAAHSKNSVRNNNTTTQSTSTADFATTLRREIDATHTPLDRTTSASSVPSSPSVARYTALFESAGASYSLPPGLLAAVAQVESGGNPRAVSPAGARGLMQLMPATARNLGVDPFDPQQAVDGAARLLRSGLTQFGSLDLALASYNAGPGAVRKYGGIPPYPETQNYVRKVNELLGAAR
ncbi:MAG: hypothetical protein CSA58_05345 [Micrococcales bacterium]|nr:MAG: hypothetical protein CSB46_04475 [Micrococcales bacterium]PIE27210.1 MAG: hypothetical protein CSA58_05345 [Micrococcales bacterium]